MLDLTFLYAHKGRPFRSHGFDELIHEKEIEDQLIETGASSSPASFPVVVWRCTRACNLNCLHCYSDSFPPPTYPELSTDEARRMIDDLAAARVSTLVIGGGEPLLRPDVVELASRAVGEGMDVILATNGTLLTENLARQLKAVGVSYVSVGLSGIGEANDYYRGRHGAFAGALSGIRAAAGAGLKVVLRVHLTRHSLRQIPDIFQFIEENGIQTVFFYHLFPAGRALPLVMPTAEEMRVGMDAILDGTRRANVGDRYVRVFIAGNVCDGAYVYKKLVDEDSPRSHVVNDYLMAEAERFGTQGSEPLCIDWFGDVHPNPFWLSRTLGNIKSERLADIVRRSASENPVAFPAWNTELSGRCASCRYVSLCLSGFQPAVLTDEELRASYPKCYLNSADRTC